MKVISIGTDPKLFQENSSVLQRQKDYASKLEELHIFVFTRKPHKDIKINNLYIYSVNIFLFLFDGFWKIRKVLKEKKDYVVTTQDPFETGLLGIIIKYIFKAPLQIQIHTDFLDPHFKNSILNKLRVFISKLTIPKANEIRVVSTVIQNSLTEKYPDIKLKIDVLPIWVDVKEYNYIVEGMENLLFPFTVLMVSRLSKEKRIDLAIKSFKKVLVNTKREDIGLYIVGDGPEKDNIINLRDNLGLKDKIKIHGWENDLFAFYLSSKIFYLTSDFEGYGMTLIEAGASRCPIVTTKVGIAKTDLFQDGINSYVCPVGDVECLSEKLILLLGDENKRESFSKKMKENIQSGAISREDYIKQYVGLLEKLTTK